LDDLANGKISTASMNHPLSIVRHRLNARAFWTPACIAMPSSQFALMEATKKRAAKLEEIRRLQGPATDGA
jgi:hypothetical protein